MEKVKSKVMEKVMKTMQDPKIMMRALAEGLENLEIDIKVHGIRPTKDGKEDRLWISILMPKIELPEIPMLEIETPEETETTEAKQE